MKREWIQDKYTKRDCLDAVLVNQQENQAPALRVPAPPNSLASLPLSTEPLPPGDLTGHMLHANELP